MTAPTLREYQVEAKLMISVDPHVFGEYNEGAEQLQLNEEFFSCKLSPPSRSEADLFVRTARHRSRLGWAFCVERDMEQDTARRSREEFAEKLPAAHRIRGTRPILLDKKRFSAIQCECGNAKHKRAKTCRQCYEERVVLACSECEATFLTRRCRPKVTCGSSCANRRRGRASGLTQARKALRVCEWCGRQDMVAPSRSIRRFCSTKCSHRAKEGSGNGNWKGGQSTWRLWFYSSSKWKRVCRSVWTRDNSSCRHCGQKHTPGRRFEVHHVGSVRDFPDLRLSEDNLVLLCNPCHRLVHSKKNIAGHFLWSVNQ